MNKLKSLRSSCRHIILVSLSALALSGCTQHVPRGDDASFPPHLLPLAPLPKVTIPTWQDILPYTFHWKNVLKQCARGELLTADSVRVTQSATAERTLPTIQ